MDLNPRDMIPNLISNKMQKIIILSFIVFFIVSCSNENGNKNSTQEKVTNISRIDEWNKICAKNLEKCYTSKSCDREFKALEYIKQYFYKVDGNLPSISESKAKRLAFLKEETSIKDGTFFLKENDEKNKSYRMKLFSEEMYSDKDYYIFKLQQRNRELIKELEYLPTKENSIQRLDKYLQLLRSDKFYSISEQSDATQMINQFIEARRLINDALKENDSDIQRLVDLNSYQLVEKSFGNYADFKKSDLRRQDFFDVDMMGLIRCQLMYLGKN
jgi:sulfur relay (sulfurtransferase) DsrC/TusE family protein